MIKIIIQTSKKLRMQQQNKGTITIFLSLFFLGPVYSSSLFLMSTSRIIRNNTSAAGETQQEQQSCWYFSVACFQSSAIGRPFCLLEECISFNICYSLEAAAAVCLLSSSLVLDTAVDYIFLSRKKLQHYVLNGTLAMDSTKKTGGGYQDDGEGGLFTMGAKTDAKQDV